MLKMLGTILCAALLVAGCSPSADGDPAQIPEPAGEPIEGGQAAAGVTLTGREAVAEMVRVACDVGFVNFRELGAVPFLCETFILSVAPDGAVNPAPYQEAMQAGRTDAASELVRYAWDQTWVDWLAGAVLVCDRTRTGPQDSDERDITLAALETVAPGLSRQIYEQAAAVFCPTAATPTEPGPPDGMTVQGAIDSLCSTPISQLPDLIDAGDSAYWTEVVQVLAVSEGIRVGPIDGQYGPQTIAGVQELQRRVGVVDDGQVGPITWTALQAYFC